VGDVACLVNDINGLFTCIYWDNNGSEYELMAKKLRHVGPRLHGGVAIREFRRVNLTFSYRVSNIVSFERGRRAHTRPP
jgi:hypothetical protein